ncbi:MAG: inorganic phosphate transporter [Phycisphaerae bacterium]|nr:inorganic phosphate transporter [Phycisphaerae bacterium]
MVESLKSLLEGMPPFFIMSGLLAAGMLIWDTVEVGRNDATNLVNAVVGSGVLLRRAAVRVAGIGVVIGATASSQVVETARSGIFEPRGLSIEQAVAIYVAVYIVDTILLYGYSSFGMPISTTACLIFELLGASFAMGGFDVVYWGKASTVVSAIICSIFISGIAGFVIQRAVRNAVRDRGDDPAVLRVHGGWIGGGILTSLTYFMIVKGMPGLLKLVPILGAGKVWIHETPLRIAVFIFGMWTIYALIIHLLLKLWGERFARQLFPLLAIFGTVCMGFAFGQNDLANCASPGLSALHLIFHWNEDVSVGTGVPIHWFFLFICGLLLLVGMNTKNAARVIRAAVNTGSQGNTVRLYAPQWCINIARFLLQFRKPAPILAPVAIKAPTGKRSHYDATRACVILTVGGCVIATASSFGLPVSTTYVAFAAVFATGMADRVLQRGDADLKLARTVWVVFSWFASAAIAAVASCGVCLVVYHLGPAGILIGVGGNLLLRSYLRKRGDAQEERVREQARDRRHPEDFTEYDD